MSVTFNPNQQEYSIGNLQGTELIVKEEKIDYKTRSTGHAKIHEVGINNLRILEKETLITFIYMIANINRPPKTSWANLGKYFQDGYLCFSKHQHKMVIGRKTSQGAISKHLKELREIGFIRQIGKEKFKRNGVVVPIIVYCLGEFNIHEGNKTEVHYYELERDLLSKLVKNKQSLFSHNIKYQDISHAK